MPRAILLEATSVVLNAINRELGLIEETPAYLVLASLGPPGISPESHGYEDPAQIAELLSPEAEAYQKCASAVSQEVSNRTPECGDFTIGWFRLKPGEDTPYSIPRVWGLSPVHDCPDLIKGWKPGVDGNIE